MKILKDEILECISKSSSDELMALNNRYCDVFNTEGIIYNLDEDFFESFCPNAYKFATSTNGTNFNLSDRYAQFDTDECLYSFKTITTKDLCELPQTMAEFIEKEFNKFYDLDIFSYIEEI